MDFSNTLQIFAIISALLLCIGEFFVRRNKSNKETGEEAEIWMHQRGPLMKLVQKKGYMTQDDYYKTRADAIKAIENKEVTK